MRVLGILKVYCPAEVVHLHEGIPRVQTQEYLAKHCDYFEVGPGYTPCKWYNMSENSCGNKAVMRQLTDKNKS